MITESVEQGHAPMLKLSNIVCYWLVNGCACIFVSRYLIWKEILVEPLQRQKERVIHITKMSTFK